MFDEIAEESAKVGMWREADEFVSKSPKKKSTKHAVASWS